MDGDALCDSEEDVTAELALCRQTDNHHGSSRSEVVDSLLVGSRASSGDDSGVGSCTTSGLADILHQVLGFPEVNPLLSTQLRAGFFLVVAGVCILRCWRVSSETSPSLPIAMTRRPFATAY